MGHQKEAANCGYWPLYRYDPRLSGEGKHPFHLDSHQPTAPFKDFAMKEARFAMLTRSNPVRAEQLLALAQNDINERWHFYEQMAGVERSAPAPRPARGGEVMTPNLTTRYLGLELKNPVVVAACPLTGQVETLRRLEDAGAAAVVLPSLFEEQLEHDEMAIHRFYESGSESFPEALSYFPDLDDYNTGPDSYLGLISAAKRAISVPVIASLNGSSPGGWVRHAKQVQEAGADALELNIYFVCTEPYITGEQLETRYVELVADVCAVVSIPLAVKISPFFSSLPNMVMRLTAPGPTASSCSTASCSRISTWRPFGSPPS